jgi:AcrR family transcriptional regulator
MVIKRRAIDETQKQKRRGDILEAAMQLFKENAYEAVNMATVARQADLAKGTLYLYFKTKEELFLALLSQFFREWFRALNRGLKRFILAKKPCGVDELATLIGRTFQNRTEFRRLIMILHTVLENNIDQATALDFKQMLYERISYTGHLMEECLPFLKFGDGVLLLFRIHALVIGYQQLSSPAPIIQHIIEDYGMDSFNIEFNEHFLGALKDMLLGFQARNTNQK